MWRIVASPTVRVPAVSRNEDIHDFAVSVEEREEIVGGRSWNKENTNQ